MSLVTGLIKDYNGFRLEIPAMEIPDEGITVLWGPSGAGKTSLFRNLIGLEDCKGLSWSFQGMNLMNLPIAERRLGVVLQNFGLFPHMTAKQNVKFGAQARKVMNSEAKMSVLRESLNLENCWHRNVKVLSVGEQQRVALARAVIGDPVFLFLDEPFSALDEKNKQEARSLLKKLVREKKIPTLLITHDKGDVEYLADHIIRINNGQIIEP